MIKKGFDKYYDTLNIYLRKGWRKLFYIEPLYRLNEIKRNYGKIELDLYGYNSILRNDFILIMTMSL